MDENVKIEAIDIRRKSGTPVFKIGTTAGGDEILTEKSLTVGDLNLLVGKTYSASTTLYFTLSGGTIDVNINYKPEYF